jgi:hypothetical protein
VVYRDKQEVLLTRESEYSNRGNFNDKLQYGKIEKSSSLAQPKPNHGETIAKTKSNKLFQQYHDINEISRDMNNKKRAFEMQKSSPKNDFYPEKKGSSMKIPDATKVHNMGTDIAYITNKIKAASQLQYGNPKTQTNLNAKFQQKSKN